MKWELKIREQRELRKQGAALLYQRVKLCRECYESSEFPEWCAENGTNDLDYLDRELEDTAATFFTLHAVFEAYPNESDWKSRNIRELIAEVLANQKRDRPSERISWKERCLSAEKECERLRAELEAMKISIENLKESLEIVSGGKSRKAVA